MSSLVLFMVRRRAGVFPLILLVLAVLNGGCGPRQISVEDPIHKAASGMGPVYDGGDDGIPLTPAQAQALNATGQVDQGLTEAEFKEVTAQYKFFLRKGRSTMERFAQRSQLYLAFARKVFRDRGMPEELAYLAIVESGYNPKAVSPAGAAGAWQFMPYTGMKYGLNQDWWIDERLDPYKATEAAADYLSKLYGDFRDWHLAVAAYNAGEGKIGRAMEGTGAKSFSAIKEKNHKLDPKAQLREETKQYVPRFLAVCKIMRNLEKLGFEPVDMTQPPHLTRVEARPGTDLMAMAEAMGQNWSDFSEGNAAHKRYVTHASRQTYVYVPAHKRAAAMAYVNTPRTGNGWKTMTAGKGESWQTLSRKTGIPEAALLAANRGTTLRAGATVRLPAGPGFRMPSPATEVASKATAPKGRSGAQGHVAVMGTTTSAESVYVLQPGDTLGKVARENNTNVDTLLALNGISDPRQVRAGQKVRIPGDAALPSVASATSQGRAVPVASSVAAVRPASAAERAKPTAAVASVKGQPVAIASQGASGSLGGAPQKAAKAATTYTVQPGDTLWAIARKHNISTNDLLTLNRTDGKSPLRPGDKLFISEQ